MNIQHQGINDGLSKAKLRGGTSVAIPLFPTSNHMPVQAMNPDPCIMNLTTNRLIG